MSDYYHGIRTSFAQGAISIPNVIGSGIACVIGTAPVHTVGGKANEIIKGERFDEAAALLGYSADREKYTLCEVMDSHLNVYQIAPVFFINVLDPNTHKTPVDAKDYDVMNAQIKLPFEAISGRVIVKAEGGADDKYGQGEDYELFYSDNALVLEIIPGGRIAENTEKLNIAFDAIDPTLVKPEDIIGGFDVSEKKRSGLSLIDSIFPKFGIACDIILCPGYSHNKDVAAVMIKKAEKINSLFPAKAYIDVDTSIYYNEVPAWKKQNDINSKTAYLLYGFGIKGGKKYHASTLAAAITAITDISNDGCPCESPSNKSLDIDGVVNNEGEEILLDIQEANYLNSNGVATILRFSENFVLWGNELSNYPSETKEEDIYISYSRTINWIAAIITLTYWARVDITMNRRQIDSVLDAINIWLNGLVSGEKLLGARVEFLDAENSLAALTRGKARFHLYVCPPGVMKELEFIIEYDASYFASLLAA